jgi:hypothetical protein
MPTAGSATDTTPPVVEGVSVIRIKKKRGPATIRIIFNERLDPGSAGNIANYTLRIKMGRKLKPIPVRSAQYDASSRAVILTPGKSIQKGKPIILEIAGGLVDLSGNPLQGGHFSTTLRG